MSGERQLDETLIESALEEILGGVSPPDLKDRILTKLNSMTSSSVVESSVVESSDLDLKDMPSPDDFDESQKSDKPPRQIVVPDVGAVALDSTTSIRHARRVRSSGSSLWVGALVAACMLAMFGVVAFIVNQDNDAPALVQTPNADSISTEVDAAPPLPDSVPEEKAPVLIAEDDHDRVHDESSIPQPKPEEDSDVRIVKSLELFPESISGSVERMADAEVVAFIDEQIASKWKENGVKPSRQSSSDAWCSTTFLKLVGRAPSRRELREFRLTSGTTRKAELVERLLTDTGYQDEFVAHWTTQLGLSSSEGLRDGEPFDQLVQQEIRALNGKDSLQDVVQVCNTFLGKRFDCVACHDGNEGGQSKDRLVQLANTFGDSDGPSRIQFADAVARSDQMRVATVNRVWRAMFDMGFVVENDFTGDPQVSHPELLDGLAAQFNQHDHSFRKLVSWIALSDTFGLSEAKPNTDSPSVFRTALFSGRYSPAFVQDSIVGNLSMLTDQQIFVLGADPGQPLLGSAETLEDRKVKFNKRRHLGLMARKNSDSEAALIPLGLTKRIAASRGLNSSEKVNHVFLAAAQRTASSSEMAVAKVVLKSNKKNKTSALRDIWWAILRGGESSKTN